MADAYTLELVEPGGADLGELSALSLEGFLHDAGLLGDDGDSAQRAATRWAPLVTLPGGGAADAPTVMDVGLPSPSSVLRCIDAEHPLDCTRCGDAATRPRSAVTGCRCVHAALIACVLAGAHLRRLMLRRSSSLEVRREQNLFARPRA